MGTILAKKVDELSQSGNEQHYGNEIKIECPILLLTADPSLDAIVTPETGKHAAQLWKSTRKSKWQ